MTAVLRAESVTRSIGDAAILRGISLAIEAGEHVALVGPSGCGKTTLLHVLGLLDAPTTGRVLVGADDASAWSTRRRARARTHELGIVFQDGNLFEHLTARDNVALPAWLLHGSRTRATTAADELLERLGLRDRATTRASALSMGEAQRVAIARAVINKPRVVLLDEPTGSLDAAAGARVLDLLAEIHAGGSALLVVTHTPEVAARATRTLTMRDGQLV
jgi:putative ABC transport system ATP-binding protein